MTNIKFFCSKRNNSNWSLYTLAMQPLFMHNASSNFSERILHKSICVFAHTCLQNDALLKTTCIIVVHSLVWAYCTVSTEQCMFVKKIMEKMQRYWWTLWQCQRAGGRLTSTSVQLRTRLTGKTPLRANPTSQGKARSKLKYLAFLFGRGGT